MRAECAAAVVKAIGRSLTKAELDGIEERITRAMRNTARRDPQAWTAKPLQERLQEGAKAAAQELVGEQVLKQRRAALTIAARSRIRQYLADQAGRGIDGIDSLDRMIAFHADAKGNFVSLEKQAQAIENDGLRQMLGTLEASNPKWFGLFENQQGVESVVRAIFGEKTGVPEADAGATEWQTVTSALRDRFNRAGGDVGELDDWGMPHHHSQSKVALAGRDQWVQDILPHLDREHYFNPDGTRMTDPQLNDFLKEAWTTIATGGANKLEPGTFAGGGARANRGNASRQIHFKDADAYMDYQTKYGDKSLYEVLVGHIEGISKDIALTEVFGPNPDQTFRLFRDEAVRDAKLADPTKIDKIDSRSINTENLYNVVAGKTQPVASRWLATTFDTLRNWLIASRLGSSIITSFSDEATLHLTARLNHLPEMQLIRNQLATFNPANRMEERMAMLAGLALNTLKSTLNRFGQNGLGKSFSSKLANSVMRVSGLNAITDARKRGFGVTMMGAIGGVTKEHGSLADLDKHDHRMLLSKGISEDDFQVWKKAEQEDWGGGNDTMLTPESIYRIPDAEIDKVIAPRIQGLHDSANAQIQALQDRNTQDQSWAQKRTDKLRQWVKDQQGRLAQQASTADANTRARIDGIRKRLSGLYDQLDIANSYFKETKKNQVSLSDLRRAGVSEGRNQSAIDQLATKLKKAAADTTSLKEGLEGDFKEKFVAREQEIQSLIESGDERKIAFAMDKFDELFTEANARLTHRLEGADEKLTAKINKSVEQVSKLREQIKAADDLWNRANTSRPNFGDLRSQGVREGRAREAATNLKQQIRSITKELASSKQEKALDFAEKWAAKKAELDEFTDRANERAGRRQAVMDRIQREIEPAIAGERMRAREQAVTKLLGAILEETDTAVIEPGAREKAFTGSGLQRGTWKGELTRSFFLFKSFPLAMIYRHISRGMSLPTGTGRAAYIAALMASTTVLGALSLEVNEVLSGRDPKDLNPFNVGGKTGAGRNLLAAFLKGGSLGIYGDLLFSDTTQYGNSPLASLTGPVLSSAEDLFNLSQGNVVKTLNDKKTNVGADIVRFVKGNTPGASLWYLKAAMDHMIWQNLQEYYSPGYLSRMRARAQTDFHQNFFWEPGQAVPQRAPDLTKTVQ